MALTPPRAASNALLVGLARRPETLLAPCCACRSARHAASWWGASWSSTSSHQRSQLPCRFEVPGLLPVLSAERSDATPRRQLLRAGPVPTATPCTIGLAASPGSTPLTAAACLPLAGRRHRRAVLRRPVARQADPRQLQAAVAHAPPACRWDAPPAGLHALGSAARLSPFWPQPLPCSVGLPPRRPLISSPPLLNPTRAGWRLLLRPTSSRTPPPFLLSVFQAWSSWMPWAACRKPHTNGCAGGPPQAGQWRRLRCGAGRAPAVQPAACPCLGCRAVCRLGSSRRLGNGRVGADAQQPLRTPHLFGSLVVVSFVYFTAEPKDMFSADRLQSGRQHQPWVAEPAGLPPDR